MKRIVAVVIAAALAFVVSLVPGLTDANWFGIVVVAAIVAMLTRRLGLFDYLLAAFAVLILLVPMFAPDLVDSSYGMVAWGVICGVAAAWLTQLLFMRRHEDSHH